MNHRYDALLVVSFGGPEGPEQVMPFLDNVLRGKRVPEERKRAVAEHYQHFGGVSPINAQNRALIAALEELFENRGPSLCVYLGNRNCPPLLADTLRQMAEDGVRQALAFVTSAYGSYSSCRQYRENIERARQEVGDRAPQVDKLRLFYNHPGFIQANADAVCEALAKTSGTDSVPVVFTAHSIPVSMASGSGYQQQLEEACRLVADRVGHSRWRLVYQSRSGSPHQPWLEPDVCDHLTDLREQGAGEVVLSPIGFISDHMEVLYDLDTEAKQLCDRIGLAMTRAATAGLQPQFVSMIRELVLERFDEGVPRRAWGSYRPAPDQCAPGCCPYPVRG